VEIDPQPNEHGQETANCNRRIAARPGLGRMSSSTSSSSARPASINSGEWPPIDSRRQCSCREESVVAAGMEAGYLVAIIGEGADSPGKS